MSAEKKNIMLSFALLYTVDLQRITAAGQRSPRLVIGPFLTRTSPWQ